MLYPDGKSWSERGRGPVMFCTKLLLFGLEVVAIVNENILCHGDMELISLMVKAKRHHSKLVFCTSLSGFPDGNYFLLLKVFSSIPPYPHN